MPRLRGGQCGLWCRPRALLQWSSGNVVSWGPYLYTSARDSATLSPMTAELDPPARHPNHVIAAIDDGHFQKKGSDGKPVCRIDKQPMPCKVLRDASMANRGRVFEKMAKTPPMHLGYQR